MYVSQEAGDGTKKSWIFSLLPKINQTTVRWPLLRQQSPCPNTHVLVGWRREPEDKRKKNLLCSHEFKDRQFNKQK